CRGVTGLVPQPLCMKFKVNPRTGQLGDRSYWCDGSVSSVYTEAGRTGIKFGAERYFHADHSFYWNLGFSRSLPPALVLGSSWASPDRVRKSNPECARGGASILLRGRFSDWTATVRS